MGAMVPEAVEKLLLLAARKRTTDSVTVEYTSKGFKSHMKGADKVHARYAVLIGEDEMQNGTVWVKDLESKEEKIIPIDHL
jgi:histidyl-tRNA synthetase